MTNEELAIAIQNGQEDKLPILWQQVERFIKKMANRYSQYEGGFAEFDDLYNAGYIAFIQAVRTYVENTNMSFIGWLAYYLKAEFLEARYGGRGRNIKKDPLNYAASLDAPLDDEDDCTLNDIVPDPYDDMAKTEERLYIENLRRDLQKAIEGIPEIEQRVIKALYFDNRTITDLAKEMNSTYEGVHLIRSKALSCLRKHKNSHVIRKYIDENSNFYKKSGYSSFMNSGGSSVEWIAIDREELRREIEKPIYHSQSI